MLSYNSGHSVYKKSGTSEIDNANSEKYKRKYKFIKRTIKDLLFVSINTTLTKLEHS